MEPPGGEDGSARGVLITGLPNGLATRVIQTLQSRLPTAAIRIESPAAAIVAAVRDQPTVVLLGDGLPVPDAIALAEFIQRLVPSTVIIAMLDDPLGEQARALIGAGVHEVAGTSEVCLARLWDRIQLGRVRRIRQQRLEADGLSDPLTGLLNRRGFLRWARAQLHYLDRVGGQAVILLGDLDGLKRINDRFGHRAGDEALRLAAMALHTALRSSDAVARIGGDEFAALAVSAGEEEAQGIALRVSTTLSSLAHARRVSLPRGMPPPSLTLGWAVYRGGSGVSLDALLDAADVHLYAEKAARQPPNEVDSR